MSNTECNENYLSGILDELEKLKTANVKELDNLSTKVQNLSSKLDEIVITLRMINTTLSK